MKQILTTIFAFALTLGAWAQTDTMFVHQKQTIYEFNTSEVDSIIFYRTGASIKPAVIHDTVFVYKVGAVTLSTTDTILAPNRTFILTATVLPDEAPNKNVSWSSDNAAIAKVDATGKVTAVAKGNAVITVTTEDGNRTATCNVEVDNLVQSVSISQAGAVMKVAETLQLSAIINPANATNKNYTWSTSNASIATVSVTGLVTAVAEGAVSITATTEEGNKTVACRIVVSANDAIGCNMTATPGFGADLGTVSFETNKTWMVGDQIWSDYVTAVNCSSRDTMNGGATGVAAFNNYLADCRSNPTQKGDLFSWCAVARFKDSLCPAPWHVPTAADYAELDIAMGGTGLNTTNMTHKNKYHDSLVWGGFYHGYCSNLGKITMMGDAYFWNQSSSDTNQGMMGGYAANGYVGPLNRGYKSMGLALRCVKPSLVKTVKFATATTWTNASGQVWSDAVQATGCEKTDFNGGVAGGPYLADCRENGTYKGHLFSWQAIQEYKNQLCPAPWRVPTKEELITLNKAMGGTGANMGNANMAVVNNYLNEWGGEYGGRYYNGYNGQGSNAFYWCSTESNATTGMATDFYNDGYYDPYNNLVKQHGAMLRCIKEAEGLNLDTVPNFGADLGTVSFKTATTWTVGDQEWSDAVIADSCQKTHYFGGDVATNAAAKTYLAECRKHDSVNQGDLFSWCAVVRFQNVLCPGDWRMPSSADFVALDKALGGTGENLAPGSAEAGNMIQEYTSKWGATFGGVCSPTGVMSGVNQIGSYASKSEMDLTRHYNMYLMQMTGYNIVAPMNFSDKGGGRPVRCVKNTND